MKRFLAVLATVALLIGAGQMLLKAAPPLPFVTGKRSFTAQTAALDSTVLFTPSTSDPKDYRVSAYVNGQTCVEALPQLAWTDEFGAKSSPISGIFFGQPNTAYTNQDAVIHSVANQPVTISTIYNTNGCGAASDYNVYITWIGI